MKNAIVRIEIDALTMINTFFLNDHHCKDSRVLYRRQPSWNASTHKKLDCIIACVKDTIRSSNEFTRLFRTFSQVRARTKENSIIDDVIDFHLSDYSQDSRQKFEHTNSEGRSEALSSIDTCGSRDANVTSIVILMIARYAIALQERCE